MAKEENSELFQNSSTALRFVWRCKTSRPNNFLLAGNRAGFDPIIKSLMQIREDRIKGAKNRSFEISCCKPSKIPPALIYWQEKPKLNKFAEVSIEEVEKYYKSISREFQGFTWYTSLKISVTESPLEHTDVQNQTVQAKISWDNLDLVIEKLQNYTFPCAFSKAISSGESFHNQLWLASDWLGVD